MRISDWSSDVCSSDLVVARPLHSFGDRRVGAAGGIDVGAAVDAVVVEDNHEDRQVVAADGLHLHAGEAEGAIALDGEHRTTGLHRGRDGLDYADAHDATGADVQALAGLVNVDDAA